MDASNARTERVADGLGAVLGLANASGQLTESCAYTAFGTGVVAGPGAAAYRDAGRRLDGETGLYHGRARAYSPTLGRFLQADPIGTQGRINVYVYAGNDPVNGTGPSGNAAASSDGSYFLKAVGFIDKNSYVAAAVALTKVLGDGLEDPAADAAAAAEVLAARAGEVELTAAERLGANKAAGAAFEQTMEAELKQSGLAVEKKVTLETASGVRTRIYLVNRNPETGAIGCIECKASQIARLLIEQKRELPEVAETGTTILGDGKPEFTDFLNLSATVVQIVCRN